MKNNRQSEDLKTINDVFLDAPVLWSMLDANAHLRHSAYADFAAQARVNALKFLEIDRELYQLGLGPILFREEIIYHKEIRMNDQVKVTVQLSKYRRDGARYSIKSFIYNSSGKHCATVEVDGAWLNLKSRKLEPLPGHLNGMFQKLPQTLDFSITPLPQV